jgi:hypothetical protein
MSPKDGPQHRPHATAGKRNALQQPSRVADRVRTGRLRARATAVYGLASLATLGLAGASAAHFSGGLTAPSEPRRDRPAQAAGEAPARERIGHLQLANSGGGFFSFLEGLFGMEPPRRAPRPSHRRELPLPQRLPPKEVEPAPPVSPPEAVATYRTMCVRLCWRLPLADLRELAVTSRLASRAAAARPRSTPTPTPAVRSTRW